MSKVRQRPGSGMFYGWWLVLAGFLLQGIATAVISYSYGVMLTPIAQEFSANRFEMMLGVTASTLVSGLLSPFLGIAMDRYSLARLASAGVALLGLALLALSAVRGITQVVLVYALLMAPAMMLMGPMLVGVLLARWFSRRRGTAMGIAALGTSVCGLLVPIALQWGIDAAGWRVSLQVLGVAVLGLLLPMAWLLLEDHPGKRGLAPDGEPAQDAQKAHAMPVAASSTAELFAQRNFWFVALTLGVLFSVYSSLLSHLVPFANGRGFEGERAAMLISVIAVLGMLGKVLFGLVADRIDLRIGLAVALLLLIAGLALYSVDGGYVLLLAGSALIGLAAGGMLPVWGSLMAVLFGAANYGRAMGLMNPVMMPLVVLGPPAAGWAFDVSGDYTIAFISFGVALLVGLAALAGVRMPPTALHARPLATSAADR